MASQFSRCHFVLLLATIVVLGLGAVCSAETIKVRVLNNKTGEPLPKQPVSLTLLYDKDQPKPAKYESSLRAETDAKGEATFELPDPPPLHLAAVRLTSEHWHCGCVVVGTTSDLLRKGSVGPEPSLHAGGPSFPAGPGEIVILARPFTFRERLLYPLLKE